MPSVKISELKAAAASLKKAFTEAADPKHTGDTDVTATEVRQYGHSRQDGFVTGAAMTTFFKWAAQGNRSATLASVKQRVDDGVSAVMRRDRNKNNVIDDGELPALKGLSSFQALYKAAGAWPFDSGDTWYDLLQRATITATRTYTSAAKVPNNLKDLVLIAGNQDASPAKTLGEAIEQMDMNEVVVRYLKDPKTDRQLIVVDYGAGDNTYGAIFDRESRKALVRVQDGDFLQTLLPVPK